MKENANLKDQNEILKNGQLAKDKEIEELKISFKELEIRLCHAEGQIKRER